jgi:hypothetical protein
MRLPPTLATFVAGYSIFEMASGSESTIGGTLIRERMTCFYVNDEKQIKAGIGEVVVVPVALRGIVIAIKGTFVKCWVSAPAWKQGIHSS